ncbi:dNA primase [Bacteroides sp. CAG:530]|nr:dNA primase [Bacteroides sp. CAG:530]
MLLEIFFVIYNIHNFVPSITINEVTMIDQATIDRILDAAQIVDVVSEFVTLRRRGVNYIGLCPFHNEKTPSFSVSPSKGLCKCFSCGKGGNVVHFIMEHEQLSYYEALKWLARKYNIEVKERELTEEEKQASNLRESLFVVNQFASEYFQNVLYNVEEGQRIGMTYLRSRGFRDDIIKKFQLGYSTDNRDALARTAIEKGYKPEFLEKTGLCYRKDDGTLRDRFWGRVIFPVHTLSGKVVAFGGRVLNAATKNVQMKYVNSPESEIYHKSRELYGIYFAKQAMVRQDRCFLVEGYTDVISMHQSGIENVVASSGTALTSDQIRLIHRFTNNITVLYDGDGAGIKASIRGIDMLLEEGMNVKVCLLPDGDDPDSFARKHNATEYQAYINDHEVDFIRFKTDLLIEEAGKDPIKKANLITSIVKSISVIPDSITRNVYIRECSEMLRMEERVLVNAVGKLKEQADENRKKEEQRKEYRARLQAEQQATQQVAVSTPPADAEVSTPPPADAEVSGALASLSGADAPIESIVPGDELPPMPEEGGVDSSYPPAPVEDNYISFIPAEGNEEELFYKQEVDLMRMLIRYGEKVMCMAEDEEGNEIPVTVAEYIAEGLHNDSLGFHIALHRRVLNECVAHIHDSGFCAERYFVSHLDPEVSKLAAEMASDRYVLSKYHSRGQKIVTDEERLYELIPRLLVDFKLNIVTAELNHILKALTTNSEISRDSKSAYEIMQRYKQLHEVRIVLARHAGDRVVLRY